MGGEPFRKKPADRRVAGVEPARIGAERRLFPEGFTAHLIGEGRIFAIAQAMLCRD